MPRQPLIPKDLLKLYPSWYTRWGHSGAVMHLRSYLIMRAGYGLEWYRKHHEAIEAKLIDMELELGEKGAG